MSGKKKATSGSGPAPSAKPKGDTLAQHEILTAAIEGFIQSRVNFESSSVIAKLLDTMDKCTSLETVFEEPIRQRLLGMEAALCWALFLAVAPARAIEEGDTPFADGTFSAQNALAMIATVYDNGTQDAVWCHFEADEEEEDEEASDIEDDAAEPTTVAGP